MEIAKISDYFLNLDNMDDLYIWEISNLKNKNIFEIEPNSINFFNLKLLSKMKGAISDKNLEIRNKTASGNDLKTSFFHSERIDFHSNEFFVPETNLKFCIFTFDEIFTSNTQFYFLSQDTIKTFGLEPKDENYIWKLSLQNINSLTNLTPNKIFFSKSTTNTSEIEKIIFEFDNSILFNEISFYGDIKDSTYNQSQKDIALPIKLNKGIAIPSFSNPIFVDKSVSVYNGSVNSKQQLQYTEVKNAFDNFSKRINLSTLLSEEQDQTLIKKLIEDTEKATKGSNPEISDILKWNDFKISEHFNKTEITQIRKNQIQKVILALSENIASSHSFNGGLNSQHKGYLMFYLQKTANPNEFEVRSNFFFSKSNAIIPSFFGLLNKNIIEVDNKIITLPSLNHVIQPTNITSSPIDFNKNSFNFDYITYSFFNTSEKVQNFFGHSTILEEQKTQKVYCNWKTIKTNDEGADLRNEYWQQKFINEEKIIGYKNLMKRHCPYITDNAEFVDDRHPITEQKFYTGDWLIMYGDTPGTEAYLLKTTLPTSEWIKMARRNSTTLIFTTQTNWRYKTTRTEFRPNDIYIFNYVEWQQFLKSLRVNEVVAAEFVLNDVFRPNYQITKLNKIIIKNIFGKNINIKIKYKNQSQTKDYYIDLASVENEASTTTIINF